MDNFATWLNAVVEEGGEAGMDAVCGSGEMRGLLRMRLIGLRLNRWMRMRGANQDVGLHRHSLAISSASSLSSSAVILIASG